jgi:hypothetical protein
MNSIERNINYVNPRPENYPVVRQVLFSFIQKFIPHFQNNLKIFDNQKDFGVDTHAINHTFTKNCPARKLRRQQGKKERPQGKNIPMRTYALKWDLCQTA